MDKVKLNLLKSLAKIKDNAAILELADAYYFHQNKKDLSPKIVQQIFDAYDLLAKEGNPHAMTTLGSMYYEGIHLPQDFKKAKLWYEKAAKKNHPLAINNLGYCYYYGRDIPKDLKRAFYLFSKAAQLNHHNGMYKLGDMYFNGDYVEKDPQAAFYWYSQAEKMIHNQIPEYPNIAYRLGHCYFLGKGVLQDSFFALEWLQKAELNCYRLMNLGDAYAYLTLIQVQKDLAALRKILDNTQNYSGADLGVHDPLHSSEK